MRGEATLDKRGLRGEGLAPSRRHRGWARRAANLLGSVLLTFFGLLAITFVIGRVVPIDPVLPKMATSLTPTILPHPAQRS